MTQKTLWEYRDPDLSGRKPLISNGTTIREPARNLFESPCALERWRECKRAGAVCHVCKTVPNIPKPPPPPPKKRGKPPAAGTDILEIGMPVYAKGSETSRQAAIAIEPHVATQRGQVLEFIRSRGTYGATRPEIELALDMSGNSVRPRIKELLAEARGFTHPDSWLIDRDGKRGKYEVLVARG